jgi:hypothetical protein
MLPSTCIVKLQRVQGIRTYCIYWMPDMRQSCRAYTDLHRNYYSISVAAKRINSIPGCRKQGVKRLNVGLLHAAQRLPWIDHESPNRETYPQDCLSSHCDVLEQSWRMIVLLRCWGCSVTPCYAGCGIPRLEMR